MINISDYHLFSILFTRNCSKIFPTTLRYRYSHYPHYTEETTETHRVSNLLKLSELEIGRAAFVSRQLGITVHILNHYAI